MRSYIGITVCFSTNEKLYNAMLLADDATAITQMKTS